MMNLFVQDYFNTNDFILVAPRGALLLRQKYPKPLRGVSKFPPDPPYNDLGVSPLKTPPVLYTRYTNIQAFYRLQVRCGRFLSLCPEVVPKAEGSGVSPAVSRGVGEIRNPPRFCLLFSRKVGQRSTN